MGPTPLWLPPALKKTVPSKASATERAAGTAAAPVEGALFRRSTVCAYHGG